MTGSSDEISRNTPPDPLEIENAARIWGVETEYWDIWGQQHHASTELESAILSSLGVDTRSSATLLDAIQRREQRARLTPLAPTLFLTAGSTPYEIPVSLAANHAGTHAALRIQLENGGSVELEFPLEQILATKHLCLPDDLPLGYHALSLQIAGESWRPSRLIVCPGRAFEPAWLEQGRAAGLAISLYGLRSLRNWGCGDTTDLCALIDWVAQRTETSFIALNPLHAIANRQPYNTSPYLPNSIFYRNPIYLDVEAIPDFRSSARAMARINLWRSKRKSHRCATPSWWNTRACTLSSSAS